MVAAQQPVTIGDITVEPGDVVIGEFDGVLVVPKADAVRVLLKAEEMVSPEGRVR